MTRMKKATIGAAALLLIGITPALAEGDHGGHGDHDHEYQDADCTPADDATGDESLQVFEEREHHGNGRTECVIASDPSGQICPDDVEGDDCYIAYDPYQEDTEEGNSSHDRGPALRYHNGDKYAEGHHHGSFGCWNELEGSTVLGGEGDPAVFDEADVDEHEAGKAEIQAEMWEAVGQYAGDTGFTDAMADGWYFYPIGASKSLHMVRTQDSEGAQGLNVEGPNVESFVIGMTDDGWQPLNAMFMLGNDGPVKDVDADGDGQVDPEHDTDGDGYIDNDAEGIDFKRVEEHQLPLWESTLTPGLVCDLPWHDHLGYEGVATSFDPENPDESDWMSHADLYAADGDPFAEEAGHDGSEPHAYWEPYRRVPALCNPSGPCL